MYHISILKKKKPWTSWPTCSSPVNNREGSLEATLKVTVNIQIGPGEAHGNKMAPTKKQQEAIQISHRGTHSSIFSPLRLFKIEIKIALNLFTHLLRCYWHLPHLPFLASVISQDLLHNWTQASSGEWTTTGPARTIGDNFYQDLLSRGG